MSEPFFSVLVTAYNRAAVLPRCIASATGQTDADLEIVVVDDGSTDDTPSVLAGIDDPRLRAVRHERNRGISPARATAAAHARGAWLVVLDSDWELVPDALARLRELIADLPPDVGIIRSRLRADDGSLQPGIVPDGVTDYRGRLEWCNAVDAAGLASDAGHCIHRSVVQKEGFLARRGGVETLWELDVARFTRSLWVTDVLGLQHTDGSHSHSRDTDPRRLVPRLLAEAPDMFWVAETLLDRHGDGLARFAPHYRMSVEKNAGLHGFLAGHRRAGTRHTVAVLRGRSLGEPALWVTLLLGAIGPRPLAYAQAIKRRRGFKR